MIAREEGVDEMIKPYIELINGSTILTSILYDIDMLPEQCRTRIGAVRLGVFCELFKKIPAEAWKRDED